MKQHIQTLAALYEVLGLRVMKILAGDDAIAAEVVVGPSEEVHLWILGADGHLTRAAA